MKKLSLLVAGLMLTAGVFAETVTKTVNELVTANKWKVSSGNDIQDIVTDFSLDEVISVSTTGEPNCGTFWTNKDDVTDWRLYQNKGGNVTIAAAEGYTLTSVTLAYNNKNNGVLIDNDDNVVANGTKYDLSNVSSVTFAVGKSKDDGKDNGQAQITSFTVTYEKTGGETIAKPTFSPVTTEFEEKIEVTITTSKSNEIHYTLDGTNPTAKSTLYNGPITLTETTTIKAIAYNVEKDLASAVVEQTYTKKEAAKPITIAEAIEKAKDTEVLVEGVMVAVAEIGAVLQDETAMIYCYKNVDAVKVGDRVRATAKIAEYGGAKQLSNGTYEVLGTEEVTYPTAEKWTAAAMDAWVDDANREKKYVTFDATLNISGNYYNLTIDGATNTVSIIKPVEDIAAMNNSVVTVTGYAMYVSGSKTKYAYVVATSVEEKEPAVISSYANLEALVAAEIASGTTVEVTLNKAVIKKIYAKKTGERIGIYFDIQKEDKDIELYYAAEEMPKDWIEGGKLSGTIVAPWVRFVYNDNFNNWELAPAGTWHWTSLTYEAPKTAVEDVIADKKAHKVVENGVIYIIRNGVRYNALGAIAD